MAFKLNKTEAERKAHFVAELNAMWAKVEDAVSEYNDKIEGLRAGIENAVAQYNEVLQEACSFVEDIANEADTEIDNKSEKWQESDKGQAAQEWRDAWQGIDFSDLEPDYPEPFEIDMPDHAGELEGLADEAEG